MIITISVLALLLDKLAPPKKMLSHAGAVKNS